MPQFRIVPKTQDEPAVDVQQAVEVLPAIQSLKCREVDVLQDGDYAYSMRSDAEGAWLIFHR